MTQRMPLISYLLNVPVAVDKGAFVLELSSGVSHIQRTLDSYVVTPELLDRFDEALRLIQQALDTGSSKAAVVSPRSRRSPPRRPTSSTATTASPRPSSSPPSSRRSRRCAT